MEISINQKFDLVFLVKYYNTEQVINICKDNNYKYMIVKREEIGCSEFTIFDVSINKSCAIKKIAKDNKIQLF